MLRGSETNRILVRCLAVVVCTRLVLIVADLFGLLNTMGGAYVFIENLPIFISQICIYTVVQEWFLIIFRVKQLSKPYIKG